MRSLILTAAAVAGALLASSTVAAQNPAPWPELPSGWIGISLQVQDVVGTHDVQVVITEVAPDGPARQAGLRAGDRLLSVNGLRGAALSRLGESLRLQPGDQVDIEVDRSGRRIEVTLQATARPERLLGPMGVVSATEVDSVVTSWVRAIEQLRVTLVERAGASSLADEGVDSVARMLRIVTSGEPDRVAAGVKAPFEFFLFRSEAHDSLNFEMQELNERMMGIRDRLTDREQALLRGERRARLESEVKSLQVELLDAEQQSAVLEAAMARAARETAGARYLRPADAKSGADTDRDAVVAPFSPLTPYLVGRNRIAGAEVVEVRPELARYFEVSGGVLIVDVAPGTPAAMAGLRPGDVVTHIDQFVIRSVEGLRAAVSRAEATVPLSLVREGATVQVLLRR
jgi:C-terminal processing protease CtpA/Prc